MENSPSLKIMVPTERRAGIVTQRTRERIPDSDALVSTIIVVSAPMADNNPKGSYTSGSAFLACNTHTAPAHYSGSRRARTLRKPCPSALGALASVPEFSTDALMRQKASEKRKEHRWPE